MTVLDDERRRYFRMNDLIGLRYRLLSEGETQLAMQAKPSALKNLLSQVEDEIIVALAQIKNTDSNTYHVLNLFNQKLNLVMGQGVVKNAEDLTCIRACQVSLSACGIAFPCSSAAKLNQHIEIELSLNQGNVHLSLIAAVIACEDALDEVNENTQLIRADFISISDVDQEHLIQYIIKRQGQQLGGQRKAKTLLSDHAP
ncbi:MAG: hypothetical protein ACI9T9_000556 [Oleiphilaceae bacterium]|jgi:hypothetical protein